MSPDPIETRPEIHDFDFIHGRWTVAHRRLQQRGVGAEDWDEFPAVSSCSPLLGGLANLEEMACPARGWSGIALRTFDLEAGLWSVRWVNTLNGQVQPPVRGRFGPDGCVLEGPDEDGGRPIIARYIWSRIHSPAPRWSQQFSYDDGATWETNWIMDFTPAADMATSAPPPSVVAT